MLFVKIIVSAKVAHVCYSFAKGFLSNIKIKKGFANRMSEGAKTIIDDLKKDVAYKAYNLALENPHSIINQTHNNTNNMRSVASVLLAVFLAWFGISNWNK